MITVYLSNEVSAQDELSIRKHIERENLVNSDFNGVEFAISRDDCTWIDAEGFADQGAVGRLYSEINNILDGVE